MESYCFDAFLYYLLGVVRNQLKTYTEYVASEEVYLLGPHETKFRASLPPACHELDSPCVSHSRFYVIFLIIIFSTYKIFTIS
jgi:hypothetical protein